MDPKMDAGMLCNRATSIPSTWQEMVDGGHVSVSGLAGDLDPVHVSQIIDQSLACLVTWLEAQACPPLTLKQGTTWSSRHDRR